jgi:hypothetical protein
MSHSNQHKPSAPEAECPFVSESAAALLSTPAHNGHSTVAAASPFGQSMPIFSPPSEREDSSSSIISQIAPPPTPLSHVHSSVPSIARVLFDYRAETNEELTLKADQLIEVTRGALHLSSLLQTPTNVCCRS